MPAPILFAHRLVRRQAELRRTGQLPWLGPDAKSQVTFRYEDRRPVAFEAVVLSFMVEAEGVTRTRSAEIVDAKRKEFDLTPAGIIQYIDLQRPIYYPTAAYGHFGRDDLTLPWEQISSTSSSADLISQ